MISDITNSWIEGRRRLVLIVIGAVIFAAFLVLISACGEPAPTTGKVTDKRFTPEHWEGGWENCSYLDTWTEWECDEEGDTYWEEHYTWEEDQWDLKLYKCEAKDNGDQKCNEGWRETSQYEYDRHGVGDYYPKVDEHAGRN